MGKTRTTFSLDEDVVRSMRIAAARQGLRDSEVVEAALREYLGWGVIERIQAASPFKDLDEDAVMAMVNEEIHAMRAEKRAAAERKTG